MSTTKSLIFVLGMHRSGTSAMTRVVNLLGANLGKDLLSAVEGVNSDGFWENQAIVDFNEKLLKLLGLSWYDLSVINYDCLPEGCLAQLKVEARSLLGEQFSGQELIAIKDPRICRLLPFWLELAESLDYQCSVIRVIRHPMEVAGSLKKRDELPLEYGLALWLLYNIEAFGSAPDCSAVTVSYDDLLLDWRDPVENIQSALNLEKLCLTDEASEKLNTEISSKLRHQVSSQEWVNDKFTKAVSSVYQSLSESANLSSVNIADGIELLGKLQQSPYSEIISATVDALLDRGKQLSRSGEELSYAQSMVLQKDEQLGGLVDELSYAQSVVAQRDAQNLEKDQLITELIQQKEYAESVVQLRDEQLSRIRKNPLTRILVKMLIDTPVDEKN